MDSPERLVIGVAAANTDGFHVEKANALNRLQCLFGKSADTAVFAAEVALAELNSALAAHGAEAIKERSLVFSGVSLGDARTGEGASLQAIAQTWMSALSSLYVHIPDVRDGVAHVDTAAEEGASVAGGDRLPLLVADDVIARDPSQAGFFSEDIRLRRQRRSRIGLAGVGIDYASPNLVANFATLGPTARLGTVDGIKRKIFDLIVRRDEEQTSLLGQRPHEIIVYSPGMRDPLVSEKQREVLDEVHDLLAEQARREEINFLPATGVDVIADRIVYVAGHA
ncbi:hypothetical protein HNP47_002847 [Brevundimonas vesicularis]|uniref:Uncharacterized protein n=1 Tax=Brevundimonas vesicularis TaxID=41276 RepID=A0A7W9L6V7_BREVE|nr:hypothetical protein [Brevundimonas vesicularis]MBB5772827.1 hypothetical protein [Brevundimonas vesicularis]